MKKFNPTSLPYIMALAQTIQIGHAGYVLMGWVGVLIGGVIGGGVSFSVAYAGSQIASLTGQKREKWANPAMFAMMGLSPLLIAAAAYISFSIISQPWLRWVTACSWAVAPDLAIFLTGLITGKKLVAEESGLQSETKAKRKSAKRKKADYVCRYAGAGCGQKFATQNAANAHARGCAYKPTIIDVSVDRR